MILPPSPENPVVIVGAGISGLSSAQLLAEAGIPVVVLDKLSVPGGLGRSFRYPLGDQELVIIPGASPVELLLER